MSEWWTYRLQDFLLFSPRVYWRMFELHNAGWWPLHAVTFAVGLAIIVHGLRRSNERGLWIGLVLAAVWAFVGWSFMWIRYAPINWAVAYVAPAFWLQALLLAAGAAVGGLTFGERNVAGRLGLLLATAGLVAYPFLSLFLGRRWAEAEVFGIAPDPTAIVTLGIIFAAKGRLIALLFPIPLLWLPLSGLTLYPMGDPQAWAPFRPPEQRWSSWSCAAFCDNSALRSWEPSGVLRSSK